jgi:hypothetical protein
MKWALKGFLSAQVPSGIAWRSGLGLLNVALGCDALHCNDSDDPTLERAGFILAYRPDQPGDGRPHQVQRRLLAPILGEASPSGFDRIGGFDGLHACAGGRGTRNDSATEPGYQRNIKQ